jgi:hypothetical protein
VVSAITAAVQSRQTSKAAMGIRNRSLAIDFETFEFFTALPPARMQTAESHS